jgi:serine/threonine/tyrosine-interacting-like protein 1
MILGGYERFSAEYPFLRMQKIMYTSLVSWSCPDYLMKLRMMLCLSLQELQNLPRYPSEILPLFLYLGERCHAYNAAMNYDLKIHAHISLGTELESAYPGTITELHYDISDEPGQDLLSKFDEIYEFLGQ